jgi:hypothetical protein
LGDENLGEAAYIEPDEEARMFAEQGKLIFANTIICATI